MYSFLVLLPITLITATLGGLLVLTPQVADYVEYIASLEGRSDSALAAQIPLHIAAYAIASFALVATAHTISAPVESDRSTLARLQRVLEAIFVAVPSVTIIALATYANIRFSKISGAAADARDAATGILAVLSWTPRAAVGIAAVGVLAVVLADFRRDSRRFKTTVIAIVAGIPAVMMVALQLVALINDGSWLLALSAAVGAIGLAASVAAVVLPKRRELFLSTLRPLCITTVDLIAGLVLAVCIALVLSLWLRPAEVAAFVGMFPVLFLASTTALLVVAFVFARRWSAPIAILSVATSIMVVFHVVDGLLPTREFRYRSEMPKGVNPNNADVSRIRDIQIERSIPNLPDAFRDWLKHRRPAIAKYREMGKTYPAFVVAAQGGGIYAAYHSALSLARLYDRCPAFANHVFALSGVSGGAFGSAVFAELLHSVPESLRSNPGELSECKSLPDDQKLERKVKDFFAADFLSPVIDSALVFDIPSWFVPWLRFPLDRAYALEYGFENAWKKALGKSAGTDASYGLQANFYGRWKPEGPAPALILATTAVNSGAPVLVSQIYWSQEGVQRVVPTRRGSADEDVLQDLVRRMERQSDQKGQSLIGNILDFRPDLQVATSTAIALSARFPYVTPPANIERNRRIEEPVGLYRNIDVLELLDGGIFENSGGLVAIELLENMVFNTTGWNNDFKEFTGDLDFRIARFTDRPAQRYGRAAEEEHFELVAPLIALNSARVARGAALQDPGRFKEIAIYLADPWFSPTLSWLLSKNDKIGIEVRSGGEVDEDSKVCCRVIATFLGRRQKEFLLDAKLQDAEKLKGRRSGYLDRITEVEKFAPNNGAAFDTLLKVVQEGGKRDSKSAEGGKTAAQ